MIMKMKRFFCLVMVMGIFSFLFGCGKMQGPSVTEPVSEPEMIVPMELPEGARLTGLYMNHMGMRMEPYYILKTVESDTYMKITDKAPDDYWMYGEEKTEDLVQPAQYFAYVETVRDEEYASLVRMEDETVLRQIEECIVKYGALGWDGYDKSEAMPDVLDSGDNYNLYLELSDGTAVKMHGYNVCPKGFRELYREVVEIFEECSDYSRYMAKNFTDSPCEYLQVELKDSEHPYVCSKLCLRKNGGEWSVLLEDEDGSVLEKGTKIAEYSATGKEVPFERFLSLMSRYQVEKWNGYQTPGSGIGPHFNIYMWFENGTNFEARGSEFPEGYEAFKYAFVQEIYDFYMEEMHGVKKPEATLAEQICGSYLYEPEAENTDPEDEEGFCEEYYIEIRYMNEMLLAEVSYQADSNSVYSRHMAELQPVEDGILNSTTETKIRLTGREFSGFSMGGEYWNEEASLELEVIDEGILYRMDGSEKEQRLKRVENRPSMHDEDMLREYFSQIVDVPLMSEEKLEEIGILGEWYAAAMVDGKRETSYLLFEENGMMWFMRKNEGEPVEQYRGVYGISDEKDHEAIYVTAERSGCPYAPTYGIWHRGVSFQDMETEPALMLYDGDEVMPLLICRSEEGMLEFSRERK